jgi:hypothetical protein
MTLERRYVNISCQEQEAWEQQTSFLAKLRPGSEKKD